MKALGLDLSLSATGIAVVSTAGVVHVETFGTSGKKPMMERCSLIAGRVLGVIDEHQPDVIVIEDYAVSKFGGSVIASVSLGAIIRYFFRQKEIAYWTAPPTVVKGFLSGSGNTPKEKMMMLVLKKWGFEAADNNQADAYVLAKMGLGTVIQPELVYEQGAVKKMTHVRHG